MEQLIVLLVLIGIGYFFGKRAETRHLKSLRQREHRIQGLYITAIGAKGPLPRALCRRAHGGQCCHLF